jgi:hypothetical protein
MKLVFVALILIVGAAVSGYFFGQMTPTQETTTSVTPTTQGTSTSSSQWPWCENTVAKFRIQYPDGWFTNQGEAASSCQYFHPSDFTVTDGKPSLDPMISVDFSETPTTIADLKTKTSATDENQVLLSQTAVVISGQNWERVEIEGTGAGGLTKGARQVYYFHADSATPVVISYTETAPNPDRLEMIQILDDMALTFTPLN